MEKLARYIVAFFLLAITVSVLAETLTTIRNRGNMNTLNVEIYTDSECLSELKLIDWGNLTNRDLKQSPIYFLKNPFPKDDILDVNMTYGDFSPPELENYIFLSWNYSTTTLKPSDVLPVYFLIETNGWPPQGDFNFNIYLIGEF